MTMAELIRRMTDLGATPPLISFVVEAVEEMSGTSPGQVRDIIRKYERDRRLKSRKKANKTKGSAEANDAAPAPENVPDIRPNSRIASCDLSSLPSLLPEEATEKVRKKSRGDTRARGTRLPADWQPSEADRQYAIDRGVNPDELRDEFVDYWTGVPGQRGFKLNWPGTWRNRVRDVAGKGKQHVYRNGSAPRTDLQRALDKAREYARTGDQEHTSIPEDEPANRH